MNNWSFKENSLDLLRLIAASQVMVLHAFEFTMHEVTNSLFFELLRLFPGVPIFFFISGYLISKSYERSPSQLSYWKNRGLRIFPALIICVLLNIIMVWSTGYLDNKDVSLLDLFKLFLAKVTILQFYNPEFMRGFGDGVLNGSLWTICVELQFYFLVPILYSILKRKIANANTILVILMLVFMVANRALYMLEPKYSESVLWKLYRVSFIPWVYMFIFGILVQRNFEFFSSLISKIPTAYMVFGYLLLMMFVSSFGFEFGNSIPPFVFFPLALVIFRFAYSFVGFSKNVLKGNDISYGIYIWHMPIVNQLIYLTSAKESVIQVWLVIILTVVVSWLSWRLLEKPILKMKNFSIHKISK